MSHDLPGEKRCLQLSEVEIMSGGKNIAMGGKAMQSTTTNGGDASRALNGDRRVNTELEKQQAP